MHLDIAQQISSWVWLLPVAVATWGVKELREMARSMSELNKNVAVIVERVTGHDEQIERNTRHLQDVDKRVVALEVTRRA